MHYSAADAVAPYDWPNFVVNLIIGIATLAAVAVAIWQSRAAREQAEQARADAADARRREDERDERDAQRAAQERRDAILRRAERQALGVGARTRWGVLGENDETTIRPLLINDSGRPLRDLRISFKPPEGSVIDEFLWTSSHAEGMNATGLTRVWPADDIRHLRHTDVPFTVEFTDVYRDRWRVVPGETIELLSTTEPVVK